MQKYLKKRCPSDQEGNQQQNWHAQKQTKHEDLTHIRVVAWNCNGISARLKSKSDVDEIQEFIKKYQPHLLFISEIRLPASSPKGAKRYDGTPRSRNIINRNDKAAAAEATAVDAFLSSKELSNYNSYFSLADWKYSGTCLLIKKTVKKPTKIRFSLNHYANFHSDSSSHEPEGRVIVVYYRNLAILHTYTPNNGWENKSFERRAKWDQSVAQFTKEVIADGFNLIYMGDLNCAPTDLDLSHPSFFKSAKPERHSVSGSKNATEVISAQDAGQPGCTPNEQLRFLQLLSGADLIDVYRLKNPTVDPDHGFSWRGTAGREIAHMGKYYGKGMRIDHALVSSKLKDRVEKSFLSGSKPERIGFMGSDHCPIHLVVNIQGLDL